MDNDEFSRLILNYCKTLYIIYFDLMRIIFHE